MTLVFGSDCFCFRDILAGNAFASGNGGQADKRTQPGINPFFHKHLRKLFFY